MTRQLALGQVEGGREGRQEPARRDGRGSDQVEPASASLVLPPAGRACCRRPVEEADDVVVGRVGGRLRVA